MGSPWKCSSLELIRTNCWHKVAATLWVSFILNLRFFPWKFYWVHPMEISKILIKTSLDSERFASLQEGSGCSSLGCFHPGTCAWLNEGKTSCLVKLLSQQGELQTLLFFWKGIKSHIKSRFISPVLNRTNSSNSLSVKVVPVSPFMNHNSLGLGGCLVARATVVYLLFI